MKLDDALACMPVAPEQFGFADFTSRTGLSKNAGMKALGRAVSLGKVHRLRRGCIHYTALYVVASVRKRSH